MQEIHLASAILLFLTRASPLSFGGGQVQKHWYRYVWGHLTTNTLQHNRFEPKHAKIIFLVTFQTIPPIDCLWLLLESPPLFTSAPPSSNRCFGAASPTLLQRKVLLLPVVLSEAQHTLCQGINSEIIGEKAHRKWVCNSAALWILPSLLGSAWKYFQIFTAENTFCSCAHTYLIEWCLCLL